MSKQAVQAFLQKSKDDAKLREKLQALASTHQQMLAAEVVKLAAQAGFTFTLQEYQETVRDVLAQEHAAGELSDAELGRVAGGVLVSRGKVGGEVMAC